MRIRNLKFLRQGFRRAILFKQLLRALSTFLALPSIDMENKCTLGYGLRFFRQSPARSMSR